MAALVAAGIASGCQSATQAPIIRPGAPGQPSRSVSAAEASDLSRVGYTPADVEFMQGMIAHHAQAVEMTTLLKTRTESEDMRRMAQRIDLSQTDEINMMRDWLRARGQDVPDEHAHHAHMMPGMLTPEQMQKLSEARGREFDRLFLEGMIAHHQGALTMVADLLAKPGAGQASDVFEFASDVEGDQRMEIQRMSSMLQEMSR
jgi:uncharacterized protein (DUF305 family)